MAGMLQLRKVQILQGFVQSVARNWPQSMVSRNKTAHETILARVSVEYIVNKTLRNILLMAYATTNPYTGEKLKTFPDATDQEIQTALTEAYDAFKHGVTHLLPNAPR